MKPKSEKSLELYRLLLKRGYSEGFCDLVTQNLNTDFTARRMIGYLNQVNKKLPAEEIADEMLAILDDRNRIIKKKEMEAVQASWNQMMSEGFGDPEDEEKDS